MAKSESKDAGDLGKQRPQVQPDISAEKTAPPAAESNRGAVGAGGSGPTALPSQFGRYRVKKKLGGGGMGTVYLVENTELQREEALKVPHFGDGDDAQARERFLREARSAARLDHANLCPVYDVGVQDGIYYLTMRFLEGKLLSNYSGKAQPVRKAVETVTRLALALEAAHGKGVIHRDLKPSNVMIVSGVGPVVMDFGLAKQVRKLDQKLTQAGMILGTPAYMPPEQVNGDLERMGPASDVYSLGVILYELLTGRLPFEAPIPAVYGQILYTEAPLPSALQPGLSPALDAICTKAMAKATTDRYPSMKAFAAALLGYLRSAPATEGVGHLAVAAASKAEILQAPTIAPGSPPAAPGPVSTPGSLVNPAAKPERGWTLAAEANAPVGPPAASSHGRPLTPPAGPAVLLTVPSPAPLTPEQRLSKASRRFWLVLAGAGTILGLMVLLMVVLIVAWSKGGPSATDKGTGKAANELAQLPNWEYEETFEKTPVGELPRGWKGPFAVARDSDKRPGLVVTEGEGMHFLVLQPPPPAQADFDWEVEYLIHGDNIGNQGQRLQLKLAGTGNELTVTVTNNGQVQIVENGPWIQATGVQLGQPASLKLMRRSDQVTVMLQGDPTFKITLPAGFVLQRLEVGLTAGTFTDKKARIYTLRLKKPAAAGSAPIDPPKPTVPEKKGKFQKK